MIFQLKNILWVYSDGCPRLASEFYIDGAAIERIMREFSMPQLEVSSLARHDSLSEMMEVHIVMSIL